MDYPYERAQRAKTHFGVSKDFGQCTGGNWSPVQDMTKIGWQVFAYIICHSLFKGGHVPSVPLNSKSLS